MHFLKCDFMFNYKCIFKSSLMKEINKVIYQCISKFRYSKVHNLLLFAESRVPVMLFTEKTKWIQAGDIYSIAPCLRNI